MSGDIWLIILGWGLGVIGSLGAGLFLFWLEGRRALRLISMEQRREDINVARNWTINGKKESLRGFDLSGANLSGKDLSNADLEDAIFEGARMWETNLKGANLIRAKFHGAMIIGASLNQSNLHLAEFDNAIVRDVDFSQSKLRRTKLASCKELSNCTWTSAQIDETTELPPELLEQIRNGE